MSAARFLSSLVAVTLLGACSGGPGTGGTIKVEPREPPGTSGTPQSPGGSGSPEPTSGGPEAPNGDSGASSSGASSGGGGSSGGAPGTCPACDQDYTCTVVGQTVTVTISLTTDDGQCIIQGSTAVFSCDGDITLNNQTIPWTPFGNGGFTVNSQTSPETCVPAATTGGPVNGSGPSGN